MVSIRWVDGTEAKTKAAAAPSIVHPPVDSQPGCSVTQACFDVGLEVGCGPGHDQNETTAVEKKQMNAKEAIAVARAKSPRNNRKDTEDIVFDDDGNPRYSNPKKATVLPPPPPPPPLPPNKRERYFPELCGVCINCGEDEAHIRVLASMSSSFDPLTRHLATL